MDRIKFPYRSSSHLALMHVVNDCGAWDRQRLSVEYDKEISRSDAHDLVPTGAVEFTSGNHVSTYAARVRGDNWVYLGQSVSQNRLCLITREDTGIAGVADIKGKKFGTKGRHPGLNDWLYLKQSGLDEDRGEFDMIRFGGFAKDDRRRNMSLTEAVRTGEFDMIRFGGFAKDDRRRNMSLTEAVRTGEVDACFLAQPKRELAVRQGLKAIEIPVQPMVWFTTVSSSLPFVQKHPDIVKRVLMGLLDGIAFFKTQRERTIRILQERHTSEGTLDLAAATKLYDELAPMLEPKLYPSLTAVANVYEEAKRQSKEAEKIHPLALWDFHFLREIDDSGYIDNLYKNHPAVASAR